MEETLSLTLKVWRQANADAEGAFKTYEATNVSPDSSFLEMLDEVNEHLNELGEEPINLLTETLVHCSILLESQNM